MESQWFAAAPPGDQGEARSYPRATNIVPLMTGKITSFPTALSSMAARQNEQNLSEEVLSFQDMSLIKLTSAQDKIVEIASSSTKNIHPRLSGSMIVALIVRLCIL